MDDQKRVIRHYCKTLRKYFSDKQCFNKCFKTFSSTDVSVSLNRQSEIGLVKRSAGRAMSNRLCNQTLHL